MLVFNFFQRKSKRPIYPTHWNRIVDCWTSVVRNLNLLIYWFVWHRFSLVSKTLVIHFRGFILNFLWFFLSIGSVRDWSGTVCILFSTLSPYRFPKKLTGRQLNWIEDWLLRIRYSIDICYLRTPVQLHRVKIDKEDRDRLRILIVEKIDRLIF